MKLKGKKHALNAGFPVVPHIAEYVAMVDGTCIVRHKL